MTPAQGTNSSEVKLHNLSAILLRLLHEESVSRVHLAQALGVSTATITNLVGELIALGLVTEEGILRGSGDQPQVGRPQRALQLVADARYAVGVHIDVGNIYIALANLRAQPLHLEVIQHALDTSWEEVRDAVVTTTQMLIEQQGIPREAIVGVGVAASGLVDPYTGVNVFAPNLNWHHVPIKEDLGASLGLPVVVDNNVRAMALGEALFGVGRDVHALAFVYARMGVGAGLVVGGQLYRGAAAGAGEIGHTTIVLEGGEPCRCGNRGCLETLFSEPVIIRLARELAARYPNSLLAQHLERGEGSVLNRIFTAAQAGDERVRAMLEERAFYMGIALANLVNIFNPELIVLGGIFRQQESLLVPTIEATVRQRAFANLGEQVRIQTTGFGDNAGAIGAAALALDNFFYRPQNQLSTVSPSEQAAIASRK